MANALCVSGKVLVNGVVKKAFYEVQLDDKITIKYGDNEIIHEVKTLPYDRKKKK